MSEFNIEFDPEDVDTVSAGDPSYELLRAVVKTINKQRPDGISAADVSALITQFLMQLRLWYKLDELHGILRQLLAIAEKSVHNEEWVNAETLEAAPPPILAEQVRDNPEGADMLAEYRAGLADEDLAKLLDEDSQ